MSSFTEVLEKALLDLVWGADAYTPAADLCRFINNRHK